MLTKTITIHYTLLRDNTAKETFLLSLIVNVVWAIHKENQYSHFIKSKVNLNETISAQSTIYITTGNNSN